ncbi:MAG: response regulator transcription factor [Planctomycetes bacterium]|nr:response regulator transcription factor [Planctomycetota bacterium]
METVLIVEDDGAMLRGLRGNFEYAGYQVIAVEDGEAGLNAALDKKPDLVLLDVMLPKINGFEVCRYIREQKLDVPIIMLTAKGQESDIVLGLNLGADDYITKPFSIKELMARAEALLRRRRSEEPVVYEFGGFRFDTQAHTLSRDGEEIKLTPKEYDVLELFLQKVGRALTRDEILNKVWGYDCFAGPRSIDRFINALRKKIEDDVQHPRFIRTVREIGYKFEVDSGTSGI